MRDTAGNKIRRHVSCTYCDMSTGGEHRANCPYAQTSFWDGVASLFSFGGRASHYNYSRSDREADSRAIQSDWQFVGQDIRNATRVFEDTLCPRK